MFVVRRMVFYAATPEVQVILVTRRHSIINVIPVTMAATGIDSALTPHFMTAVSLTTQPRLRVRASKRQARDQSALSQSGLRKVDLTKQPKRALSRTIWGQITPKLLCRPIMPIP